MQAYTKDPKLLQLLEHFSVGASVTNPGKGILEPANGFDSRRTLEVSPDLMTSGGEVVLEKEFHCETCDGLHVFSSVSQDDCPNCDGIGKLIQVLGLTRLSADCGNCLGSGKAGAFLCPDCRSVADTQPDGFKIPIPAGSKYGDVLKLEGFGGQGRGGGSNGTLFVELARPCVYLSGDQ